MDNILILSPFNGVWFLLLAVFTAIFVALSVLAHKKGEKFARHLLAYLMLGTFVLYWVYKILLINSADYSAILVENNLEAESFWKELPFQLCNINMIIIPVAVLLKKKPLMAFSLYLAPLGAFLALVMPSVGFAGYSLLLSRMWGYYLTHIMIMFGGIAIYSFGIYKPSMKDIPRTVLAVFLVFAGTFLINLLIRWAGLADANYMYSMGPDGISLLEIFYNLIPVPFLYELPCIAILLPYMFLFVGLRALIDRVFGRKKGKTGNNT